MLQLDRSSKIPLYVQLYTQLKTDITQGQLPANMPLTSKRKLAAELSISINTVELAYHQLLSEGFIFSKPQKGYYVCELEQLLPVTSGQPPHLSPQIEKNTQISVDFSLSGVDAKAFPYILWKKLFRTVWETHGEDMLSPSPIAGELSLRTAIATQIYRTRGVLCQPEQIIIGAGTEHLLQILGYLLDTDCSIAMENPVYHEAYHFFQKMGHQVLSIPIDEHGVSPASLEHLSHSILYITPSHQFPLGSTMPITRRIPLLNWANRGENRYIIEDDYDSEFKYDTKPIPALKSSDTTGKVIYLGSFSRSIAPSLRISYMVLPPALLTVYEQQYKAFTCPVSKTEQLLLAAFLQEGKYETHLNRMRKLYKEKRSFLLKQLETAFGDTITVHGENAGHHARIQVHTAMSEKQLCQKALEKGVQVYGLSPFFTGALPPQYQSMVLLGYAPLSLEEIKRGVILLKTAWCPPHDTPFFPK